MSERDELPRSVSGLPDLRWRRRVLLGRSPEVDVSGLWSVLDDARPELDERRTVALVIDGGEVRWWPEPPVDASADLDREIDALLGGAGGLLLLGLDGGAKRRYEPASFRVAELLADVDAMPMRRAERRGGPGASG